MDNHLTIRIPKKLIRATLVLALVAAVISPIAVSAAHTFSDVPDTNIFHEDITWMADSGVTAGCNPPANDNYCPKANVTREQMAAFMRRLAENQVVDAASVQGYDADSLVRATGHQWPRLGGPTFITTTPVAPGATESLGEVTINAPVAGALIINGSLSMSCSGPVIGPCNKSSGSVYVNVDGTNYARQSYVIDGGTVGTQAAIATPSNSAYVGVAAGDHTVSLDVANASGSTGTTHVWSGGINVTFVPFGADGTTP